MRDKVQTLLLVVLAIIFTGVIMDEAGKGRFGSIFKELAQKVARGYGV